jgi:hypothetical protein
MRIPTREVPQADSLERVMEAVSATASGEGTFQQIAEVLGLEERQGRYYRLAAELLGFITRAGSNRAVLTERGRKVLAVDGQERQKLLARAVLGMRLFQRVVPFLEVRSTHGCSKDELERFIHAVTEETGQTMVPRRTSTITSWLRSVGLLERHDDKFFLRAPTTGSEIIQYDSPEEPLFPPGRTLKDYVEVAERTDAAMEDIRYTIDAVRRERANRIHERLTALVAERLRGIGAIPRRNQFIDLAATVQTEFFMFEIKTTTPRNFRSQVRRGISQLYEYRYLQRIPTANLILVLEQPLPESLSWLATYLIEDRGIIPIWDGDLTSLHCAEQHHEKLGFLF